MIVCLCHAVTDGSIRAAAARGATAEDVMRSTGAGTSCGCCTDFVANIVADAGGCNSKNPCPGCPRQAASP